VILHNNAKRSFHARPAERPIIKRKVTKKLHSSQQEKRGAPLSYPESEEARFKERKREKGLRAGKVGRDNSSSQEGRTGDSLAIWEKKKKEGAEGPSSSARRKSASLLVNSVLRKERQLP